MVYFFDPSAIAAPVQIQPSISLAANGSGLAGVLQEIRDQHPERFEDLVSELRRWLPDFDAVLFQTPSNGMKSIALRTQVGRHAIPATDLSQGTLFALAMLTMAYLPQPPEVIAVEEPDRGIHPRLLREVRDALYRLAYPESFGESRKPVQVIATTHSPYLVDLFKDHPEEVVLAQKRGLHATLDRLTDQPDWEEILRDAQLGDLWYSGVLGGVPAGS
jgi:predicted ATPase